MKRHGSGRWKQMLAAGAGALLLTGATPVASADRSSGDFRIRLEGGYTLRDPSLELPPLEVLAPDLTLMARQLGDEVPPPGDVPKPERAVKWKLDYRHAELGELSSKALRTDPSTGFSRQLDTDVLALGMSWRMAGNRVGLAYQLQSARGGLGDDAGVSRFLPGSDAATHALTLGVTREFGAGVPPPAPPPLLVIEDAPAGVADDAVE